MKGILFGDIDESRSAQVGEESKQFANCPQYKALGVALDVTDAASVQNFVDLAKKEFGRIDYCINAAGVSHCCFTVQV